LGRSGFTPTHTQRRSEDRPTKATLSKETRSCQMKALKGCVRNADVCGGSALSPFLQSFLATATMINSVLSETKRLSARSKGQSGSGRSETSRSLQRTTPVPRQIRLALCSSQRPLPQKTVGKATRWGASGFGSAGLLWIKSSESLASRVGATHVIGNHGGFAPTLHVPHEVTP
jgi:hypothetical protein